MGDESTCVDAYNSSTIPVIPPQKACGEVKTIPMLTWKDMSYNCHLSCIFTFQEFSTFASIFLTHLAKKHGI